ncbi:hypothetical protein H2248_000014 [Termitomyces sp. 'cryptogamus']|nr:hypothetical protein H2248_000014 [Termitomyces sp. 'cryptogamus']
MTSSLEETDNVFIKRLEDEAGITNTLLLSDEDISRGRVLLSNARAMLNNPDFETTWALKSQSTLSLTEHIARLSIALAPHKHLPPEILQHIFCSLFAGEENNKTQYTSELAISEVPWTLGQVCRRWRQLSRTMRELWGITMVPIQPVHVSLSMENIETRLLHVLKILPDVSRIGLVISSPIQTESLIPYLSRISVLDWCVMSTMKQKSMEIFPPGSLSNIQRLVVNLGQPSLVFPELYPRSYAKLFGQSSCLTDLTLLSDTPIFLLTDIPWSQIRSFTLCTSDVNMIDCTRPTWIQLRDIFNPFASMLSLESLRFNMGEFLRITLSFQFPWNRLKSLSIQAYQRVQDGDLTEVMILTTIEKCTSLTHLEIRHPVYLSSNQPLIGPCYPINFPRIQSLTLNREIPVCLLLTLPPTIRRLRIEWVKLGFLSLILSRCFNLTALHYSIWMPTSSRCLDQPPSSFADQLAPIVAPSLTSLVVCTGPGIDSVGKIVNFLIRSGAKLEKFAYHCGKRPIDPPERTLTYLVNLLDNCTTVDIPNISLPRDLVACFVIGSIFPRVRNLDIGTSSPAEFYDMIQRRLRHEHLFDRVRLHRVRGYPREYRLEQWRRKLHNLSKLYHVECTFHRLSPNLHADFDWKDQ